MKKATLSELFDVGYGHKLDLNKMARLARSGGGVSFVGLSSQNHGVSATVAKIHGIDPYPPGFITVALGGTKLLCSFVQQNPFYTAQNVAVLRPKVPMTFAQKVYLCICIRHNRFRYSAFGREANRTIRQLEVPTLASFPKHLTETGLIDASDEAASSKRTPPLKVSQWESFRLEELFELRKGTRLTKASMLPGSTPFIGAIDSNNGLTAHVGQPANHAANTLTVNYNGNGVAETFYQPFPFRCSDDVNVLYPKFELTPAVGLFIAAVIRLEKYRFSYGRKWHLERMEKSEILLPAKKGGLPDWNWMSDYMMTLPYSSHLAREQSNPKK